MVGGAPSLNSSLYRLWYCSLNASMTDFIWASMAVANDWSSTLSAVMSDSHLLGINFPRCYDFSLIDLVGHGGCSTSNGVVLSDW